jgi:alanine-glyoxylate transaminase/serine-glyoxylate transaminase/serine-pyruvate transaminase
MKVPAGVNGAKLHSQLLGEFNIEIGGGFGALKGKLLRVGLMGHGCQKNNVLLFLAAFEKCLLDQNFRLSAGAGVGAAIRNYADAHAAVAVHK